MGRNLTARAIDATTADISVESVVSSIRCYPSYLDNFHRAIHVPREPYQAIRTCHQAISVFLSPYRDVWTSNQAIQMSCCP
ncbi:hypothetical protein LR48_Vigan07g220300 [Vigna angularis]|uniref:Uncharacterized protein n=1 Tax=Phaseolus angularis TaxID=3914 RepID=A0A0L9V189_PHAAN|nr:hypothetical protein LR48_Vigan07g220300 [Vigna angularis]